MIIAVYLAEFSKKCLNCVGHLFNERQKLKTWDELKQEYRFLENKRFLFMQLLYAIPKSWKEDLSKVKENIGYSRPSYNKKRPYVFSK